MKSSLVAIALALFAGAALAVPADASAAMLDDRQMKAVHILHNNKGALGLTKEETEKFDKFMTSMRKRSPQLGALGGLVGGGKDSGKDSGSDAEGATPTGTADPSATPTNPPKPGGILGGALLPGLL
ncbi:hypothetical protein MAC_05715 [Metarhizium acridum CQMa 102]|uniref:Uncharacterized protein n=1 Tax=Metarhizium acridum (strain CQMa 102) TaxID=655827 RepID=E9E767_METAQ|nr:uncharacterized protein MAC_05715 [Metarhizium acridum CQMa 102]EFY88242.1 hypothetical protein MAC_05715 [Metarhizium acridum CQMa 102]